MGYLYRYIDTRDNAIVYIGKSNDDLLGRIKCHQKETNFKSFLPHCLIEYAEVRDFGDQMILEGAEALLISQEQPILNTIHNHIEKPEIFLSGPGLVWKSIDKFEGSERKSRKTAICSSHERIHDDQVWIMSSHGTQVVVKTDPTRIACAFDRGEITNEALTTIKQSITWPTHIVVAQNSNSENVLRSLGWSQGMFTLLNYILKHCRCEQQTPVILTFTSKEFASLCRLQSYDLKSLREEIRNIQMHFNLCYRTNSNEYIGCIIDDVTITHDSKEEYRVQLQISMKTIE